MDSDIVIIIAHKDVINNINRSIFYNSILPLVLLLGLKIAYLNDGDDLL